MEFSLNDWIRWYRDPYDYENVVADVRVLTQLSDLIEEEDRATDFTEKLIHRSGRSNTRSKRKIPDIDKKLTRSI